MRNKILFLLIILLLGSGAYLVHSPKALTVPTIQPLHTLPQQIGSWHTVRDSVFDQATLNSLRPSDYLMRTYLNAQNIPITLYIGYHDGSASAGPIHSPKNCLPGGGWEFKSLEDINMQADDNGIHLVRAVLSKDGESTTFYYWYQVRGEIVTDDLDMKIAEFLGVFKHSRKDAAFIRISITTDDKEQEIQTMQNFFKDAYPLIKDHLPS